MTPASLAGIAALAALLCAAVTGPLARWAAVRAIVAVPNARSSHQRVTPVGGGAPLAGSVAVVVAILLAGPWPAEAWWFAFGAASLAIIAVSGYDDLSGAGTGMRLAIHAGAAGIVLWALGVDRLAMSAVPAIPVLLIAIAWFWIVGVTNAYNFMDGIDGIAGLQAVVAGANWALIGWHIGEPMTAALGAVIAGASLGFLWHNWAPARIFMGDVGSALLGFAFAVLPLVCLPDHPAHAIAGALAIWPFIFDAAFTLVRRLLRGENVLQAHRSHLYQRMVRAGLGHAPVAASYGALAVCGVALGQLVLRLGLPWGGGIAAAGLTALSLALVWSTRALERRAEARAVIQRGTARPT